MMTVEDESIKALSALAPAIYEDLARPAVKQIGSAVETVFKIGLSPVKLLDWGYEQSKAWLQQKLEERVSRIPPECLVMPSHSVTIAVVTNIAANSDQPELREIFAELLFKAMDSRFSSLVHPSYAPLLAQMSPQEALIFIGLPRIAEENASRRQGDGVFTEYWRGSIASSTPTIEMQFEEYCKSKDLPNPEQSGIWLDNLLRLSLVRIDETSEINYLPEGGDDYGTFGPSVRSNEHRYLYLTDFGVGFFNACKPADQ